MAKHNSKALAELAASMRARREREERVRQTKPAREPVKPVEPIVNEFTAKHGDYREATVVDLNNDLGGGRQKTYRVLLNRGGSAVERWINEQDSKLFGRPQIEAIRHCQRLWARIDSGSVINITGIASTHGDTTQDAQQDAMDELHSYRERLHPNWFDCFENVVRFEMPAGIAGEQMANNSRTQVEAAKLATAFVAGMIAMWRRL